MSVLLDSAILLAAAACAVPAAYLLLLTVQAWRNRDRRLIRGRYEGPRERPSKWIVLIPAHDEEQVIGQTLASLRAMSYPADAFRVAVIADNCSDRTAALARDGGAEVFERADTENRGKGQALDWAMRERLVPMDWRWDAVAVVDADSQVNADFLWFMDRELKRGAQAIQGYYGVLNPLEGWRTSLLAVALACFHFLRPLGRERMGLSCGLKGNGMGFARALVEAHGYPAGSIVEDLELACYLADRGIRVHFAPGAHVYGQMVTGSAEAAPQRLRWEGGRMPVIRTWLGRLLRGAVCERSAVKADAAMELLIPPLALLAGATFAVWLLALLAASAAYYGFAAFNLALATLALTAELIHVLSGPPVIRAPARIYLRLCFVPVFVAWKVVLLGSRVVRRGNSSENSEWVRTARHEVETDHTDPC
ncbi:glycosyltransferase family 2 protein [Kiritimatiella glycovorans]|uniref:N-glycosyltransferase n=1 Tax=Kiritimatiella glycovorans TaxID=1307763 RepID=A0A0G3EET6_9BACT|nr:glycosyltransferase family 2 protein [Kiritimatiella glycovorans]AKJ63907.1 N-glycosyltransferase [Kiritimatiella glycovorans]